MQRGDGLGGGLVSGFWGVLLALSIVSVGLADHVQPGALAGARERGVGPFASELVGAADDDGPFDGGALGAVAGERVGVLDVAAHIGEIKLALVAAVGLDDHPVGAVVDLEDSGEGAVVDVGVAVVAPGDDPVTSGELAVTHHDAAAGQAAVVSEPLAGSVVESFAGVVIASDHHRAGEAVLALGVMPLRHHIGPRGVLPVVNSQVGLFVL